MAGVRCPPVSGEASVEHRVITTGPGKSEWQFADRGLRFSSRFDGGNMAHVQLNPSGSFDVKVSEDAAAFGISTGYTTWFYFEVERTLKAAKQPQDLHVTLVNLNPQRGLFKNGYTIMHSSDEERWDRLPSPLMKIRLSLSYKFKFARERVRFAFCYPYTYTRVQEELASLDRQFADPKQHSVQSSTSPTPPTKEEISSNVYYHRELLTRSLEGLRQKKMVVISARVHPAETPANFMLNGMLQLLLHPTDESATALRRHFVFKLIPMLNPDAVCQGFYRTDTRGVNLNRVYEDPQPDLAPTVFALKNLLLDLVNDYGGAQSITAQENVVYLDLHAHANRRGCFIFGNNHLPDMRDVSDAMETAIARQVQTQLYARLVGLHTPFFDYMACLFDKESMTKNDLRDNNNATTSRQGSSRVALYRATGLTYVYTIECNYNEGRRNLRTSTVMPSSSSKRSKASTTSIQPDNLRIPRRTAPTSTRLYLKYSPADWRDVGVGALIALLDLFELPGAGQRIQDSSFRSRDGIMKNLLAEIRATTPGEATISVRPTRQKSRLVAKQQSKVK
ncbi:metalloprotease family M14A, putative [Phytophthora infestans T30-4]|uniref:Metalloprotease family M14A, putative n=1 Tax=Phytophthora infestans (strain T30-4) TaxID=403677 RepID=D0N4A9_PHYIT|nr:metalloprotease family M14A, putative [Phytophthora infestans T30-4]EEY69717.1 metalloprotease family M14A, putative [Phytophthora infestans T30-4]|eukprot:XP_002998364.1 metalloprotease family M14A, putative [Phytophthora infestans T30-4]